MSARSTRLLGLYAVAAAVVAVVTAPILALSYFGTEYGRGELERGTVAAWAEPARDLLGGVATWASPERMYSTYLQVFALLFPAVLLCALAVRRRRPRGGRTERWGWRLALAGYGLAAAGMAVAAIALIPGDPDVLGLAVAFFALLLPGMFISALGSTVLGIALLRDGFRPRLTAALLTLAFPSMVVVPTLLGHNSLGMLALVLAWGIAGFHLARASSPSTAPARPAADPALGAVAD